MVSHAHWKIARDRKVAQGIAEDPAREKLREEIALRYDLGQAVYDRRTECGISQTELARRARMTQPQVSKMEIGGTLPTLALIARLARAMDSSFSLVVDGESFHIAFTARAEADSGGVDSGGVDSGGVDSGADAGRSAEEPVAEAATRDVAHG